MGGKIWSKEEEEVFWLQIVPLSPSRKPSDFDNKEHDWDQLAQKMKELMGDNARRTYTGLMLFEHFFQNAHARRFSPHALQYAVEYLPYAVGRGRGAAAAAGDDDPGTSGSSGRPTKASSSVKKEPSAAGTTTEAGSSSSSKPKRPRVRKAAATSRVLKLRGTADKKTASESDRSRRSDAPSPASPSDAGRDRSLSPVPANPPPAPRPRNLRTPRLATALPLPPLPPLAPLPAAAPVLRRPAPWDSRLLPILGTPPPPPPPVPAPFPAGPHYHHHHYGGGYVPFGWQPVPPPRQPTHYQVGDAYGHPTGFAPADPSAPWGPLPPRPAMPPPTVPLLPRQPGYHPLYPAAASFFPPPPLAAANHQSPRTQDEGEAALGLAFLAGSSSGQGHGPAHGQPADGLGGSSEEEWGRAGRAGRHNGRRMGRDSGPVSGHGESDGGRRRSSGRVSEPAPRSYAETVVSETGSAAPSLVPDQGSAPSTPRGEPKTPKEGEE